MKRYISLIIAALLAVTVSCKNRSSETLPRDAWSQNPEGIIIKGSPDSKSQMVGVIPFGEKFTITESNDVTKSQGTDDRTKWYKTEWNGKKGWVHSSSAGDPGSVIEQIKISFNEQKSNLDPDIIKSFDPTTLKITDRYIYSGGEMEPAKMLFLSGGLMVLNSKIFNENYSNTFFKYEFTGDGNLIKIKFADKKLPFDEYADMENSSRSVFRIEKNERVIIYKIKDKGFFFMNWGFYKE